MPNIKYPTGQKPDLDNKNQTSKLVKGHARMGLDLENDVIKSCEYYLKNNICSIHKRPTPIQVMRVDNSQKNTNFIMAAKFSMKSTTDFVGCYRGRYIDFECKKTILKYFQMKNIGQHQIEHHIKVKMFGGICFFMIYMAYYDKVFLLDSKYIIEKYKEDDSSAMNLDFFEKYGHEIERGFVPRLDFIKIIDKEYFKEEFDKNNPAI